MAQCDYTDDLSRLSKVQHVENQSKHIQRTIADVQKSSNNKQSDRDHGMGTWVANGAVAPADDAEMIMDGDERPARRRWARCSLLAV